MSPQQFFSLTLSEQCAILEHTPHASERFESSFMIMLFEMDGWLLEAYYHRRAGFLQFEELTTRMAAQRFGKTMETGRLPLEVQAWMAATPKTSRLRKLQYHCQQLFNLVFVPGTAKRSSVEKRPELRSV